MRTRGQKEAEVTLLREKITRAKSLVIADYRGLSVTEANKLRSKLRTGGEGRIEYRVAKNTLLRRAVRETESEGLERYLEGPTALAIAYEEPTALVKLLVEYAKENEKFEIKGGLIEGEVVDLDTIRRLAALPSTDELRAMLMAALQAPMQNLAGTLQALLGHVRNALEQRLKQLEVEG
jgi:large subunit ribosomal protein L10